MSSENRIGAVLAILLLAWGVAFADGAPQPRFSRLSLEDGLSQSSVNCVVQDARGMIWFGTQDGLNRYDGYEFKIYKHDPQDPGSLAHNFVWALHIDREGTLWVGTEGAGLARWNPDSDTFTHYRSDPGDEQTLSHDRVRAIAEDRSGNLWVGTENGLNRFEKSTGRVTRFLHDPEDPTSLSHAEVRCIYEDRAGTLWIGTNRGGLSRFEPNTGGFVHFRHSSDDPTSLSNDRVRTILQDSTGTLWVGTYEGGLNRMETAAGTFTRYRHSPEDPAGLGHDRVRALFQDDRGTLWIGTDGGLHRWDAERERFFRYVHDPADPASLSSDRVLSLFQDRGGLLWVATQAGLNRWNLHAGSFAHFKQEGNETTTLSSNIITAFASDEGSRVWIGTYGGGLNLLDRQTGEYRHFRHEKGKRDSLSDDRVMSLYRDSEGVLWVGTMTGGLNRMDLETERFTVFRADKNDPAALGSNGITAITESRDGSLWVGTYRGGLHRYDRATETFTRYQHDAKDPASLSDDRVMVVFEDSAGSIWAGTEDGGLNRLDRNTGGFTHYRHDPQDVRSLSSDVVWSIHETGDGSLWIGTQAGGLNRWSREDRDAGRAVFRTYTEKDGLPNAFVYGILEDHSGNLWMSSNKGLSRFDPASETFTNYDASHGLQSNEFNFGAVHRGANGEMFFGGNNGFNAFQPGEITGNTHVPPVVLTGVYKLNERVEFDRPLWDLDTIEIGYRDHVVSFEFAALDFSAPEKNRYAYKLEGFDEDWNELGTMRRATYTNLDAGEYTFLVRGSNNDGVWNEAGIRLPLVVVPPPWKTWWAYTLYGLAFVAVIFRYTRVQARKLQREEEYSRKLEEEVKDRTRELAEKNVDLANANDKLKEASLTDSLTGLRNRRYLLNYMQEDIALIHRQYDAASRPGGEAKSSFPTYLFLMLDLDGFKEINDTFGHAAGDKVLLQVREIMESSTRESDTIVRWGGDEFLIVCRDLDPTATERLAERIRNSIEKTVVDLGGGQSARVGCSIGFAKYPFLPFEPTHVPWEKVIAIADRALYLAKSSGKNAWVGLQSTLKARPRNLVQQILDEPERLAREGTISIARSSPLPLPEIREKTREARDPEGN
jgi:diguanylate cyclase (GGDEF)-like protein